MKSFFKKNILGNQAKTIKIGSYNLNIVKQIAEGGFSYVFLVKDINSPSKHYALKRILIRDEDELIGVKHEISIMQRLTNHRNIVKILDFSKIVEKSGTTEMYILMEYCSGGHLVELMQKKQQSGSRFTDQEVFKIFQDICESVAYMHSQTPLIIHRDLKVENVLLDEDTGIYKLCDFGSSIESVIQMRNKQEMQIAEDDISRNTTLQYRAPEIVDFYRCSVIDEKIDIWALGCLLYKLLFYTTPFEDSGSLGILNSNYTIPTNNHYSPDLINLIRIMLNPDPTSRPNIFEITNQVQVLRNQQPIFTSHSSNILTSSLSISSPFPQSNSGNNQHQQNNQHHQQQSNNLSASITAGSSMKNAPKPLPKHPLPPHQQPQQLQHQPSPLPSSTVINSNHDSSNSSGIVNHNQLDQNTGPSPTIKRRATPGTTPSLQPVSFPGNNNGFEDPFKDSPRNNNPFDATIQQPPIINEELLNTITQLTGTEFSTMFDSNLLLKLKQMKPGKGTMHIIVKRPLKEPLVCLKSLILIHALLSEGNNIPFKADVYDSRDLFNNLYLGWLKQKERYLQLGDLLAQYSCLLFKFIIFHHKNYMIDTNFAFDEMKWGIPDQIDSVTHPISIVSIRSLFEIMDHIFLVYNSLCEYCINVIYSGNNNGTSTPPIPTLSHTLLQCCINILNSSSYSIFCFISGSIELLSKTFSDIDMKLSSSVNQFQSMYSRLRDIYSKLSQLACFSDIFFPTLPNTAPTFTIVRSNRLSNGFSDLTLNGNGVNGGGGGGSSGGHNSLSSSFDNTNNPFSTEPTFNPFNTTTITTTSATNNSDFGNFGMEQQSPRYPISVTNTSGNTPNSSTPQGSMSPVMGGKKPPLPPSIARQFPHSASLEDARLYTLILTPSPSPPLSPSMGRLSHSNSNIMTQQQQQQYYQHQQQQQALAHQHHQSHQLHPHHQQQHAQASTLSSQLPPLLHPFDSININGVPPPTFQPHHISSVNNSNSNPQSLNNSSNSISSQPSQSSHQQQQPPTNKSLMPPPIYKPAPRGHRRSQSSNGDEIRRRNLLQQQLEQNKEFLNHNRQINKQSRLNNANNLFDGDGDSAFCDEEEGDGLLN